MWFEFPEPGCVRGLDGCWMGGMEPTRRVRVKICGITNIRDALGAVSSGADALGFNLYPGSKRYIDLEKNAGWMVQVPPLVAKVAVVVNLSLERALEVAAHPAVDLVQFHGDEDTDYCARFAQSGRPFVKAIRLRGDQDVEKADCFSTPFVLVDAACGAAYGGTGKGVDLGLAIRVRERHPGLRLILAGGLGPDNVGEAAAQVRPYAVDVASGVEVAAPTKDLDLMRRFVAAAGGC
jgi:phosphoribosylanthranilate isomerase